MLGDRNVPDRHIRTESNSANRLCAPLDRQPNHRVRNFAFLCSIERLNFCDCPEVRIWEIGKKAEIRSGIFVLFFGADILGLGLISPMVLLVKLKALRKIYFLDQNGIWTGRERPSTRAKVALKH